MQLFKQLSSRINAHVLFTAALCALCLSASTVTIHAQVGDRKHTEGDTETAYQEGQAGGLISALEPKKTAIVGSWSGTLSNGRKYVATYNSDGTAHFSHQGEVSTEFPGVLTPLHGVWTYLGNRQFGATFFGVLYDINTAQLNGFVKGRLLLTLNEAGDEISDMDGAQLLDPQGNVVATIPLGPGSAKRIQFEPFN
jgi:hypothetical protein